MASASQRRMAQFQQKKDANKVYKPLLTLPRGILFTITSFTYKQSQYNDPKNPNGPKPFSLIPNFRQAETNMYTYLLFEFSSADEDSMKETVSIFNKDIADGVKTKFAFYGQWESTVKAKIHFGDEGIDEQLLRDVTLWEETASPTKSNFSPTRGNCTPPKTNSPFKREYSDDNEREAPKKKLKLFTDDN